MSEQNEIDDLIDAMISSGDKVVHDIKTNLPESMSDPFEMFHESNITALEKIRDLLNHA